MTEWRAADLIRKIKGETAERYVDRHKAFDLAVMALKEIEPYREIGTVKECREAREKQIPIKPITHRDTNRADCPVCGATVRGIKEPFGGWCSKCGQKLDWE